MLAKIRLVVLQVYRKARDPVKSMVKLCLKITIVCLFLTSLILLLYAVVDPNEANNYKTVKFTKKHGGFKHITYPIKPLDLCAALGRLNDLALCLRQMNDLLENTCIANGDQEI
ncbi:Protein of unknown function [Gryllus bimaculatus]|nr:Protein of unknown function [Gryllus bimaculatus]